MSFNHVYDTENHYHLNIMKLFSRFNPALFVVCISFFTTACESWLPEPHKLDLHQGNTIKLEQVEAIEIGMSKPEVRKIMGSPMLADPFHNQRWDYIYRFVPNKGFTRKSLLTLYFENGRLIKIDDSQYVEP